MKRYSYRLSEDEAAVIDGMRAQRRMATDADRERRKAAEKLASRVPCSGLEDQDGCGLGDGWAWKDGLCRFHYDVLHDRLCHHVLSGEEGDEDFCMRSKGDHPDFCSVHRPK